MVTNWLILAASKTIGNLCCSTATWLHYKSEIELPTHEWIINPNVEIVRFLIVEIISGTINNQMEQRFFKIGVVVWQKCYENLYK